MPSYFVMMITSNTRSEEVLGKALRRVPRHTYYIGTKVLIISITKIIILF